MTKSATKTAIKVVIGKWNVKASNLPRLVINQTGFFGKIMRCNQFSGDLPVPRTFYCANCGQKVQVTELTDRRFKYCCQQCEKNYWRKACKSKKRKE